MALDYKSSGVDIEAGYRSVELMKDAVKSTVRPEVLGSIGGFAGAFSLDKVKQMSYPVLLSGTDGVGTKLKLAFLMDKHDTIGIDCVAMCVNDIAAQGAEPLFFLDYIACGKNSPEKIARIVSGVAEGCRQSHCALIGGETAEHPGLMPEEEYDLAGFAVGVAERDGMTDGSGIAAGDVLVGIASSGVHSNGFSLVRKILDVTHTTVDTRVDALSGTAGEVLLTPTKIYVDALKAVKDKGVKLLGCAHITGGGFYENIPRMLPEGIGAKIRKDSYELPAVFEWLARAGEVDEHTMYNTFNMGIGMVLAVKAPDADAAIGALRGAGEQAFVIGETVSGEKEAVLC